MSWTVCLLVLNTIIFQNRWQFFPSIHNNFLYSTKIYIDPQLFPSNHNNFLYSTKVSIVPQLFSFSTILSFIPHDCLYNSPVYTPHWSKYCSLSTILCSFLHQQFTTSTGHNIYSTQHQQYTTTTVYNISSTQHQQCTTSTIHNINST